jgi:anti-sigma-K factor RskA
MTWPVDLIDYLSGELDAEQTAVAERLMRDDPAFRAEVERLRPLVADLRALPAEAWDRTGPPPLAPPADTGRPAAVEPRPGRPRWPSRRFTMPALAAGLAAVVLLGLGLLGGLVIARDGDDAGGGRALALRPVDSGQGSGTATVIDDRDELRLSVRGLPPSGPDDFYELWLLNSASDLVSLGSFAVGPSGTATIDVPLPVPPDRFAFVDVSVEPADGDPAHSAHSIIRGPTV